MSGVMTKVAVYGFVRIVFDLLGSPGWWWSIVVLAVGGITAVLGVLSALMQRDLKRLLAYSTIENIGIIFIGLGLALAFKANGMAAAAALAFTAALLHVLNHSLFKSLLFFGAGAVLTATGERDIEKLGGLIHPMPQTAFLFLGGCLAISALPPLNGFVSEWLMFQAILLSPALPQWGLKLLVPAVGAMLALGAALVGRLLRARLRHRLPRPAAHARCGRRARDRPRLARGHGPAARPLPAGRHPAGPRHRCSWRPSRRGSSARACRRRPPSPGCRSCRSPRAAAPTTACCVFVFITALDAAHDRGHPPLRLARACAAARPGTAASPIPTPPPSTPPTASPSPSAACSARSCSAPASASTCRRPAMPGPRASTVSVRDLVWETFYAPISDLVSVTAERLNRLQFLTIRQYLSLVFAALVGLLLVVSIWP